MNRLVLILPALLLILSGWTNQAKLEIFPAIPIPDYVDKETESPWNFFDDFEDESFDRYNLNDKGAGAKPFKFKKDPNGNTYLEITVKHGWNKQRNKYFQGNFFTERAEINPRGKFVNEKIIWYGFKVRLPKDFIHIDDRVLFHQFKNQIKSKCASPSPLLGIRFRLEGKRLNLGGDTGGVCKGKESLKKYRIQFDYDLMNKKWYPIKLRYKEIEKYGIFIGDLMSGIESFDATPLGEWTTYKVGIYSTKTDNGFVKVYKDDVLIFDYEGVTFDWGSYYYETLVRIGPYRNTDPSGKGYPPQSIHYDDFTIVSDKKTLDKYLN